MVDELSFRELLAPHATGAELERLQRYASLLERWSARHNLVSWKDRHELVRRHLVDALAARDWLVGDGSLLDVGSGAGLPGVPLLAANPRWRGVLLEPRQKRWSFLRLVVRELGLSAEVVRARFQDYGGEGGPFELITARATGAYPELLTWSRDHLPGGGRVLIWGTEALEDDLSKVLGWSMLSSPLPGLDRGRLIQLEPCFT